MHKQKVNGVELVRTPAGWRPLLPDGCPLEFDEDGYLYKAPVENPTHRTMGLHLEASLHPYVQEHFGDAAALSGNIGLYPTRGNREKYYVPDLIFSRTAGKIGGLGEPPDRSRLSYKLWQEPVPDLLVEIVSPSTWKQDLEEKPGEYQALGILEYWMLDPSGRRIPGWLQGHVCRNGTYGPAKPQRPDPDEAAVPAHVTSYYSEALELYLYADAGTLRVHSPVTGTLPLMHELVAQNRAEQTIRDRAERERDAVTKERDAATKELDAATKERDVAQARIAALEAELKKARR